MSAICGVRNLPNSKAIQKRAHPALGTSMIAAVRGLRRKPTLEILGPGDRGLGREIPLPARDESTKSKEVPK